MTDTTLRYLAMLQAIPRHPRGITASALHAKLQGLGYRIDKRSIERDLVKLSGMFPLSSSEGRPASWFWAREASQTLLPSLTPASALTFELAYRHLASLLPRGVLKALEPLFKSARKLLDESTHTGIGRWSDKVAIVPDSQPLLPPAIAGHVHETVHEALLANRQLEIGYHSAERTKPKRYPIHPLGLVSRGGSYYLVAIARDYTKPHIFALHRITDAIRLDEPATRPAGFDLHHYIREEHGFEMPHGGELHLELRVSPWLARFLDERKLAADQTLAPIRGREELRLSATVPDTEQLRWWLRSFGPNVEVARPAALRRELASEFAGMAELYRNRTSPPR